MMHLNADKAMTITTRRFLGTNSVALLSTVVLVCLSASLATAQQPAAQAPSAASRTDLSDADGWRRAAPEEVGLDASRLAEMTEAIRRQEYANVHAVLIERDGRLVYEEYFEGEDVRWGHGSGHVVFTPETLHDIRSVTKSVVSALMGVTIASGDIASVDQPLFEFFPEHADLATPEKQAVTLRHALTMSAGFEWDENIPYSDERNDEIRMTRSDDPTRFVLSRPLTSEPGALFNYSGGLTHLIAAVVQRATGRPILEYARDMLFEPLGITELEWLGDLDGLPAAASGLRLRPRDLAKFGSLYLNEGRWQDRQILPAEWVRESTRRHLPWPDPETEYGTQGYGYQWWHTLTPPETGAFEIFAAVGNGGQRILVVPALRMVVTVNAGRYNDASAGWLPEQLLFERILPAVRDLAPAGTPAVELSAVAAQKWTPEQHEAATPLIIDTDAGIDDLMAIAFLLESPGIEIEAIAVSYGLAHIDAGARNILGLLEVAGRRDIPVYEGRSTPLTGDRAFPLEWRQLTDELPGVDLPEAERAAEEKPAVVFLVERLADAARPVDILAIGALTNVAEALAAFDGPPPALRRLVIMGGAVDVPGNLHEAGPNENETAEWNFYVDAEAARRVFDSGVPIHLIPLDATDRVPLDRGYIEQLRLAPDKPVALVIAQMLEIIAPFMDLGHYFAWDPLAAATLVNPDVVRMRPESITIALEPPEDGRLYRVHSGIPNAHVAYDADEEHFRGLYIETLKRGGVPNDYGSRVDSAPSAIVKRSARVQPGELVWISGGSDDVPFMERLAVAVGAEGGHPVVTVSSDEMLRRWYREVPERFDAQREEWLWRLHELADVIIQLQSTDYSIYAEIPPERLAAWDAANAGLLDITRRRGSRVVRIGNGQFPSDWRARMLGVDRADLERTFWAGLLADPAELAASGERLREALRGASTVRVQHPNGTDLTVGIGPGHIVVTDGTTSLAPGPAGETDQLNMTWLPGGEVTLALDPERAEGRLVVERFFFDGQTLGPFTLTYSEGRMQTLESDADLSILRALLDPDVPLSDRLTGLKFGVNPHVTDARLLPWMGAGVFSLSMGSNVLLGGDLELPFYFFFTLPGATVHVDDRVVVENGVLKL
jgi:inosine-uridine nucleoside N-ribohydrolase/CubicO group peptidase (beta-lactamase class C family)/leucyl aminopeptidase (aminopeptidase T)